MMIKMRDTQVPVVPSKALPGALGAHVPEGLASVHQSLLNCPRVVLPWTTFPSMQERGQQAQSPGLRKDKRTSLPLHC